MRSRGILGLQFLIASSLAGAIAGLGATSVITSIDAVTTFRLHHSWVVWLLPIGGLCIGFFLYLLQVHAHEATHLLYEEIAEPTHRIAVQHPIAAFLASVATHLFGGSSGREGVAVQLSGGVAAVLTRKWKIDPAVRQVLLVSAIAGGFGAVFGVPVAGAVFGVEVGGRLSSRRRAVLPSLISSFLGHWITQLLGVSHEVLQEVEIRYSLSFIFRVAALAIAAGVVARLFIWALKRVRQVLEQRVSFAPLRSALGGMALLIGVAITGRSYLGLSLPIGEAARTGAVVAMGAFALKLLFTAVTLGSGFAGGEVTPMLVSGAALGVSMSEAVGGSRPELVALGTVSIYAAAVGAPITGAVLAGELFGWHLLIVALPACLLATTCTRGVQLHRLGLARPSGDQ